MSQKYKLYIISCKTAANPLNITVLNTKTLSASGALPLDPPLGTLPPGGWGLHSQIPVIG